MTIEADMDLVEVAFQVCTAPDATGITAILTGGSAATYHAPGLVNSFDPDFVMTLRSDAAPGQAVLEELGYELVGQEYRHATNPFQLDFPPGPLAVGVEILGSWQTVRRGDLALYVLTATDSCLDRLAHGFYYGSRKCQDDARRIAEVNRLDIERMRGWAQVEGCTADMERFLARLAR